MVNTGTSFVTKQYQHNNYISSNCTSVKNVQIRDKWEHFDVHFKVFNPFVQQNEDMRINGSHPAIGNWAQAGPQSMELSKKKTSEMKAEKYG